MKYQTFNRSCSYASIANLLEVFGHETQDHEIAIEMGLPYLFSYNPKSGTYLSGPMLQDKVWFDLYLNKYGFEFKQVLTDDLETFLDQSQSRYMMSMVVENQGQHAVIFEGKEDGLYKFMNNKWAHSDQCSYLYLTLDQVQEKLVQTTPFAYIERSSKTSQESNKMFDESIACFEEYKQEIINFVSKEQSFDAQTTARRRLFEPIFLDTYSMMTLIEHEGLVKKLGDLRSDYMKAYQKKRTLALQDYMDMKVFKGVLEEILLLMQKRRSS